MRKERTLTLYRDDSTVQVIFTRRDLRAEGAAEPVIDRLATDQTAAKMLAYERDVVGLLTGMFR